MKIARVVGTVVATVKHASHQGAKLLLVEFLDLANEAWSTRQIAFDRGCAGVGDTVLLIDDGGAARMITEQGEEPVDWVIAGVIDEINVKAK
jgi:microcompartment protein CcmK/EutM